MLVTFHGDCDAIYRTVEDIGVIIREIRELEDQVNFIVCHCLLLFNGIIFRLKSNRRRI